MICESKEVAMPFYTWQGFLNIFRRLLNKPIATWTQIEYTFDPPIVLAPGESLKLNITGNLTLNEPDLTKLADNSEEPHKPS